MRLCKVSVYGRYEAANRTKPVIDRLRLRSHFYKGGEKLKYVYIHMSFFDLKPGLLLQYFDSATFLLASI